MPLLTGSKSADNLNLVGLDIAIASFPAFCRISHFLYRFLYSMRQKAWKEPGNEARFGTAA